MKFTDNVNTATIQRRLLLLMSVCLTVGALLTAMFNLAFYTEAKRLAVISQGVFVLVFGFITYHTLRFNHQSWHKFAVIYAYAGLLLFIYNQFPPGNTVIQWFFSVPIMAFLLLGSVHSLLVCSLVLAISTGIFIYHGLNGDIVNWEPKLLDYIAPYLFIMGVANAYERMRAKSEKELTVLALTDSLTNTFNRKALGIRYPQKLKDDSEFCLAILDIDYFKAINDNFGHDAGDFILVELALIFKAHLPDLQIYRLGGEEFVLLLDGGLEQGVVQVEAIKTAVTEKSFNYHGNIIRIRFSAGVVKCSAGLTLSQSLKKADECLYKAKASGRNRVLTA